MRNFYPRIFLLTFGVCITSTHSFAAINLDFTESGSDLIVTVSGIIDELPSVSPQTVGRLALTQVDSRSTQVFISNVQVFANFDEYVDTSVSVFPPGSPFTVPVIPNTATGVFTSGGSFRLALSPGIYSISLLPGTQIGDSIASVATYANTSLSDLGLPSSGSGVFDLSSVSAFPDITWGVNGAVVPEPSAFGLILGCSTLFVCGRRRKSKI
ncbi:MAG: hypothetical protein AAF065_13640 [Verrucomicrobiota bacterium]